MQDAHLRVRARAPRREVAPRGQEVVAELCQVLGLPVVVAALGLGGVEVGLHRGVRLLREQVEDGIAERADRCHRGVDLAEIAGVAHGHGADTLAVPLRRYEGRRGGAQEVHPHGELAGRLAGERPVGAQDLVGSVERPRDQPAVDGRTHLVQAEGERGDDAEVGAGAANRPEQLAVLVAAGAPCPPVGRDDLHLEQVVDRPAEPARQVAEAPAERQARHPDLRDEAQRRGQPMQLRLAVHLAEEAPRLDRRGPRLRDRRRSRAAVTCRWSARRRPARCRRCCGRPRAPRARGRARARRSPPRRRRPCRWAGRRAPAPCRSCRSTGASRPRSPCPPGASSGPRRRSAKASAVASMANEVMRSAFRSRCAALAGRPRAGRAGGRRRSSRSRAAAIRSGRSRPRRSRSRIARSCAAPDQGRGNGDPREVGRRDPRQAELCAACGPATFAPGPRASSRL